MDDSSLLLAATIEKFVKNILRAYVIVDGVVEEVNDDYTCDVTINEVLYTSIPIVVLIGDMASFYPIPVIGTTCLITFRDGNRGLPQIIAFDQIDTLKINCKTLVEFNGGLNGGMVLSPKMVERMNILENKVNDFITKYNTHTHILTLTSGTGTAAPTTTAESSTTLTTQDEIQSKVITQ